MAKQLLAFVALLVLQGIASSVAAPQSSGSSPFNDWFKTVDLPTAVASKDSKINSCTGKPNGFYGEDPDFCSAFYINCVSGSAYPQWCPNGKVFDSTPGVQGCVDRYAAASAACEKYPDPACPVDNVGVYEPTEKCSEIYYICLSVYAEPTMQVCNPTTSYFNRLSKVCEPKAGAAACKVPPPPPFVPFYGCSDKTPGNAYAVSPCSVSFYTCTSATAQPTAQSCVGTAETVFDYRAAAGPISPSSCIARSSVPECPAM